MGVLLELPDDLRHELKDPFGPIYVDPEALLAETDGPIIAVGDIVTYHLLTADRTPDVALVDGKTKREAVEERVREGIEGFDVRVEVENPAATLTEELLRELRVALETEGTTVITVTEGEEDLAALPAILAAPDGSAIVYGQPDEGMVLAIVDDELRARMRDLLEGMDGDTAAALEALGVE
jgi:uncharacterized protein (UPF0218 family)